MLNWSERACRCWRDPDPAAIEEGEPIRDGMLARCRACRRLGWRRVGGQRIPVSERQLAAVRDWGTGPFPLGAHAPELAAIRDVDGVTPCRIRWTDGSVSDPAVVVVSALGPIDSFSQFFLATPTHPHRMFREVAAVEPSSFALPYDLRVETPRDRHSVHVIAPDGRSDVLSSGWPIHVAVLGRYPGAELRHGTPTVWQRLRHALADSLIPFPPGFTVVWADAQ